MFKSVAMPCSAEIEKVLVVLIAHPHRARQCFSGSLTAIARRILPPLSKLDDLRLTKGIDPSDHQNQRLAPNLTFGMETVALRSLNRILLQDSSKHGCFMMRTSAFTAAILALTTLATNRLR